MKRNTLQWAAAFLFVGANGLVHAATPLVVPVAVEEAKAKSFTEMAVRFNAAGVAQLKSGAEVELALPNGSKHDYVYEHSVDHGGGLVTWVARSPLSGDNERAIITYGPHGAWGWMKTTYGDYRIYPSGKGYDIIARREKQNFAPKFPGGDVREVGPDGPEVAPFKGIPTLVPPTITAKSIFAKVTPSPVVQSDVMILYTTDLAQKLGVGLMPMIYNVIASANQAYADSEIAIQLRLVNATMIDWPNSNLSDDTLDAMGGFGPNAAFFQSLTHGGASSLRNTVGADFVALLRDGPTDTGGIGNLPRNPVTYPTSTVTSSTAYSVNNFCASGCEGIVAHEIGHNMGMHHDPATIAKDVGTGLVSQTGVFQYSYGYYSCATGLTCNPYVAGGCAAGYAECAGNDANDFGTVMSYFSPKLMKFSNPLLSNCAPAGAPGPARACGGSVPAPAPATTSDNALSMNNVRGAISAYRNQTITTVPGSVQFTAQSYGAAEGSNIVFTVARTGGSTGAITVNYTVTAGTATAGTDFTVANGTLTWPTGDTANKSFNVATTGDAVLEGVESLTVTLSNPTGAPGVFIGYPNAATGLILEPWPVGALAALPTDPATGWSTPASPASSVGWSIVNEAGGAPPGDPDGRSLKSGAINFSVENCTDATQGPVPCPSAVELTRNFSAGTVSFQYRLSAFFFFGVFEFMVDGNVICTTTGDPANAANGGDTGWRTCSTGLTAGNHTLKWQYRPRLGFACGSPGATVGGQPYPGCQDRAWIDQLALPPNTAFADPPRLVNIATRMQVLTGDDVMIGGFIIGGSSPKTVVVRARGPSLAAQGVPGTLQNPQLQLFSGPTVIGSNDNWQTAANQAAIQAAGFAPSNTNESAIMMTLNPGPYTAIVSGVGNTTGVAIIEVFEVDGQTIPLINIATRGRVQAGDNVMIGGFIIQGNGPQQVVVRARGPSLVAQGVHGVLANPFLQLFNGPTEIANNNDWGSAANAAAIQAAGFHPSNSLESAIMMTLNPGAYTAIVSGIAGGTGVAIVEVFTVP